LEAAGVELEGNGKVKVDEYGRTSNPKVYAIGDLVNAKALAHKASDEGVVAVEHAAGAPTHPVDQNLIAGATFCHPQVASVGLTEAAAKQAGHDVKIGKLKLGAVGGATVYDDKDGMVKLVVDSKYGEILGAHIVGNRACDMIAELVATMALEGGYQELARIVHPHPTISEAIFEAARAVDGWATHA
jgi:dihydrolipoamide dehydrogenase